MAEKKMTKKDFFAQIKANYDLTDEEVAFIDHEIELLDHKNKTKEGEKKLTKTQIANQKIANQIFDMMVENHEYTITELIKAFDLKDELDRTLSVSRVSAMMSRYLVSTDKVVRTEVKGRAYFCKKKAVDEAGA